MFDLSFGEIFLVLIAALLCIGPKEMPAAVRAVMRFFKGVRGIFGEIKSAFSEMVEEPDANTTKPRMIQGDDGNMYESYDSPVNIKKTD